MTSKTLLRQQIRELKALIQPYQALIESERVREAIESLPQFKSADNIMLYHSLSDELPTLNMIERWKDSKRLFLPAIVDGRIQARELTSNLKKGSYNILEPQSEATTHDIQIIIVPGIAFDANKNRLGRGKGFYDEFLQNTSALKIGIAFDCQIVDALPTDSHDVKMDIVITARLLIA